MAAGGGGGLSLLALGLLRVTVHAWPQVVAREARGWWTVTWPDSWLGQVLGLFRAWMDPTLVLTLQACQIFHPAPRLQSQEPRRINFTSNLCFLSS